MGGEVQHESVRSHPPPDPSRLEAAAEGSTIGGLTSGPKPLRWGNRKLRKLLQSLLD
jgi:hypothetical protein